MKLKSSLIAFVGALGLAASCTPITQAAGAQRLQSLDLNTTSPAQATLSDAARPVFENYFRIHAALAQDSLQGVAESAAVIAQTVRSNPGKPFPAHLARQADRLAAAKDLMHARDAFLRMSPHVIDYVKENRLTGFYMGFCRMEKLAWLQADPAIANPYMGKAMPRCAWFRELNGEQDS
ncbi:MAG: hypothetical protein ABS95_02690 [Verrucomicrobia bacterium SCN 57-15]|nr:MAG: hypothetical protein ABS95_02690 [Verrucomicrobia bacterium SCN 57-15]